MTREQVIDEVADDRVRFVAQFRDDAADKRAAARVPFQIDCAVRIVRAVDFGPAMWAGGLFGPDFDEAKFLLELRIAHDFVPQRPPPCRDDLNHGLHLLFSESPRRETSSILNQRAKHDMNIDKSFLRMSKCARRSADDFESELLPEAHG